MGAGVLPDAFCGTDNTETEGAADPAAWIMKRLPILLSACAILFTCTACDESALNRPSPDAAVPAAVTAAASASSSGSVPSEAAVYSPEQSVPSEWIITEEQSNALRTQVAAPLAALIYRSQLSGNGMMNYNVPIADMSSYMYDSASSMWEGYFATLADVLIDTGGGYYEWIAQSVFPGFARSQEADFSYAYTVPTSEATTYFQDAFGSNIPLSGTASQSGAETTFACGSGETGPVLSTYDTGAFAPGYVEDGTVACTFHYTDALQPAQDTELMIRLGVEPAPGSVFGCNVTSFEVTQSSAAPTGYEYTDPYAAPETEVGYPDTAQIAGFDAQGFVFPDSSERYLMPEEVMALSPEMRGYARNEILARHGNVFLNEPYRSHYNQYPWYQQLQKRSGVGVQDLNDIEAENVALLELYESH